MAEITVRIAAAMIGKDRSTVLRAIESGKLSAIKDERGRFLIDTAELTRAFGSLLSPDASAAADAAAMPQTASADAARAAALEREVALLREMQRQWEEERTFLRGLVERHTDQIKLLTDQRERAEREHAVAGPSFLARLFRRSP